MALYSVSHPKLLRFLPKRSFHANCEVGASASVAAGCHRMGCGQGLEVQGRIQL